ncbi:diadenylate cyclase CdaA [Rhodocytophaga aerolata]|uniref:Diadenylate cyclase n=1 Tax=Rhodocytophaga aerolata TaxID=455078 RepID=A0ABT8R7R2_9BACT|nr:diadenylate cyclase CdaA [Rhodocytophaga aerolata]MDO1447384.1 diadenylate cyclase CdaA [Rhodocytophaga aerolata]
MRLLFSIGFLQISWVDVIDISLVTYLLYQLYKLMRGSVAIKVFLGFLSIYLSYLIVKAAEMELLTAILGQFMGVGVIAALILFQQEIRKFLLLIGKSTVFNNEHLFSFPWRRALSEKQISITPIVEAAKTMSAANTGALIVFARDSELKFYTDSGDELDAIISKRLLISIFNKYSPMHDGAVIIVKNRIKAARCILPVSENDALPASFGLRHRAAIGLTEITDAVVLVVSEETGQISLVVNGRVMHNLSGQELRNKLNQYLLESKEEEEAVRLKPEDVRNAKETA